MRFQNRRKRNREFIDSLLVRQQKFLINHAYASHYWNTAGALEWISPALTDFIGSRTQNVLRSEGLTCFFPKWLLHPLKQDDDHSPSGKPTSSLRPGWVVCRKGGIFSSKARNLRGNQLITLPITGTQRLTSTDRKWRTPFSFLSALRRTGSIQIKPTKEKFSLLNSKIIYLWHLKYLPCCIFILLTSSLFCHAVSSRIVNTCLGFTGSPSLRGRCVTRPFQSLWVWPPSLISNRWAKLATSYIELITMTIYHNYR